MRIIHPHEGWEVVTPAMVRVVDRAEDNGMSNVGVEFINPGQLYAQLQDELGRYFNRRNSERVRPEGKEPTLRIKVRGTRVTGKVFDLSVVGLGAWVDTVLAAGLKQGDDVSFSLELPGNKQPIEGQARVVRLVPQGRSKYLGLQFDVEGGSEASGTATAMRRYVGQYLDERLRRAA
jgi:c-di-GMP-binding flagellar brake protein YcgR